MEVPRLRNTQWQAALDKAMPSLEHFQDRLSAISDDLRAIEKVLTDSGFRIRTAVDVGFGDELVWMELGKGTWRVCHREQQDNGEHWNIRPLIETPAADRWRLATYIPILLDAIGASASLTPNSSPPPADAPDDDVPF